MNLPFKAVQLSARLSSRFTAMLARTALAVGLASTALNGQVPSSAQMPIAISGHPFGVFSVEIPLPKSWDGRTPRIQVDVSDDRIFYPAVDILTVDTVDQPVISPNGLGIGRPGGIVDRVRNALRPLGERRQVPVAVHVVGLFRGKEPLNLKISGDVQRRIPLAVDQINRVSRDQLLMRWWQSYSQQASQAIASERLPKLIPHYLTDMLSRRLMLPAMQVKVEEQAVDEPLQPIEMLNLLIASKTQKEQALDQLLAQALPKGQELPVPPEPAWRSVELPPADLNGDIEALATRIPPECFYLRFGSFNNYVWFQELSERFGGDLSQAVLLQGFNYDSTRRIERMLATKLTSVAKMFGDKLISDMALLGADLYIQDGASMAVLFQATNAGLLQKAIESDRRAELAKHTDARLQEMDIDGTAVTLLSTPDHRLRSFLVADGDYLLISTSRHLVQRFLAVARGEPSLADSNAFRWTRTWMPVQNNYSVFGYFSPEFFQRLMSPQYYIELQRRLSALAHIEIAEIASQVAYSEQRLDAPSIDELKQLELLPAWFDQRPDGGQVLRSGQQWWDAVRGARGSFLPISDLPVQFVTESEAQEYASLAQHYQQKWQRIDPLMLGIRQFQGEKADGETVAVEVHLAPFEPGKYGWIANSLANPSPVEIQLPKDDALSLQLHLKGSAPGESYFLFGGIKDMVPPVPEQMQGLIKSLRTLKSLPAYLGAWPKPGLIEQLPLGLGNALARPDYAGFSRMLGGLWRWQDQEWSLLSFDRSILDRAIGQLGVVRATDQAQVRGAVANLEGSQLADWINKSWWNRGWQASHANVELLKVLNQQLKVPHEQALEVAQRLLDARLQCSLAGEYRLIQPENSNANQAWATPFWESTAWSLSSLAADGTQIPPPDYQAPWIKWFRGGRLQATQQDSSMSVIAQLQLQLPPIRIKVDDGQSPSLLPPLDFDLFSLPLQMFGKNAGIPSPEQPRVPTDKRQSF